MSAVVISGRGRCMKGGGKCLVSIWSTYVRLTSDRQVIVKQTRALLISPNGVESVFRPRFPFPSPSRTGQRRVVVTQHAGWRRKRATCILQRNVCSISVYDLPSSVRSAPSLLQFRRDLKTALHVSVIVLFTIVFNCVTDCNCNLL